MRLSKLGAGVTEISIAAALVDLNPGGTRELHWHPNADEWQYWISGEARMMVFSAGGRARKFDFHAGDVGYVPRAMGHYIENTGTDPVRYLELFRSSYYIDVSLTSWMGHTTHDLVAQHLNIDPSLLDRLSMQKDSGGVNHGRDPLGSCCCPRRLREDHERVKLDVRAQAAFIAELFAVAA